jgi:hypothetical protein
MTCISITNYPMVDSDNYDLPHNLDFKLTFDCQSTLMVKGIIYFFTILHLNCDLSCVLNENSVDSAVYNFTTSLSKAINKTILSVKSVCL